MDNSDKDIPMVAYEYTMARFERTIKRLIVAMILTVILLFASNMAWLWAWNQYDYSDVTVESQDNGMTAYMGAHSNGEINNGSDRSQNQDTQKSE